MWSLWSSQFYHHNLLWSNGLLQRINKENIGRSIRVVLESNAPKDDENLTKIAKSVGFDVEKLKKDAASKEVEEYLASVKEFGDKLEVSGTPAFVVGSQIVRGYMEYEPFKTIVDEERKKLGTK